MSLRQSSNVGSHLYVWIGYANPDAVTQIANGLSTTTYAYDNDGNLISAGTGTATTTYTPDASMTVATAPDTSTSTTNSEPTTSPTL